MQLIEGEYGEDKISRVIIKHRGKFFSGFSTLAKEDEKIANRFTGCGFAEIKAEIKALKYDRNIKKQEYKICKNFVKSIENYKDFDSNSPIAKKMYRQLNIKKKEIEKIQDCIDDKCTAIKKKVLAQKRFNA